MQKKIHSFLQNQEIQLDLVPPLDQHYLACPKSIKTSEKNVLLFVSVIQYKPLSQRFQWGLDFLQDPDPQVIQSNPMETMDTVIHT